MKKGFVALLLSVLVFGLAACNQSPNSESASSTAPSPDDILQIDFDMEYYKTDYPLPLFSPEEREEGIKEWLGAAGFYNMTEREDGYVVFNVKRKDYDAFISALKEENTREILDEQEGEGPLYASFKEITCSEDLTRITITVDREIYENERQASAVSNCYRIAWEYQQVRADWDGSFTIEVKDAATGEVFESLTYPDD